MNLPAGWRSSASMQTECMVNGQPLYPGGQPRRNRSGDCGVVSGIELTDDAHCLEVALLGFRACVRDALVVEASKHRFLRGRWGDK